MTLKLMDEEIIVQGNAESALQELDKLFKALTSFMKLLQKQKKDQLNSKLSNESLVNKLSRITDM